MAETDEYLKRYNEQGANNQYYDLARQQEYKVLLDKEVALENAKTNALKYTNNVTNSNGLGATGYGSSLNSGIYNNYMNRAMEAQNNYHENIANLNLAQHTEAEAKAKEAKAEAKEAEQAAEAKADDRFQSITTLLQNASSTDSMNELLKGYGYGTIDGDNNFNWNSTKPEGMSDDDWLQMQYVYRWQKDAFDNEKEAQFNSSVVPGSGVSTFAQARDVWKCADGSDLGTLKDETEHLLSNDFASKAKVSFKDGDVMQLSARESETDDNHSVFLVYRGGKWYQTSRANYNNGGNRYWFYSDKNSSSNFNLSLNGGEAKKIKF